MRKNGSTVLLTALVMVVALAGVVLVAAPKVSAAPLGDRFAATTPVPADDSAYLGVSVVTINARIASQFKLDLTEGVVIASVVADSPAATAGLKAGDVVDSVNSVAVKTAQDVVTEVRKAKAGAVVTLVITREGKQMAIKVTSTTAPAQQNNLRGRGGKGETWPTPKPGARPQAKPTPVVPPDLKPIWDLPQDQRFSSNYGSTQTYKDKDGNVVTVYTIPGTVTAISATSITITPNNTQSRGGPFTIDNTTIIRAGTRSSSATDIKVGDKVTVVVVGNSSHAAMISAGGVMGGRGGMGRGFMQPFGGHDFQFQMPFGRGGGMQFQWPNGMFQQPPTQPSTTDKGA